MAARPAGALAEIGPVLLARALDVGGQLGLDRGRQHRQAVFVPLAVADHDLVGPEGDVLDPQATALQPAKPRP
jgi:hypothetical protein